jgi:hypothetical protein
MKTLVAMMNWRPECVQACNLDAQNSHFLVLCHIDLTLLSVILVPTHITTLQ